MLNMCFFCSNYKKLLGYTLFWIGMGMLLMYVIDGGFIGLLVIVGVLLVSYWLFS